MGKSYPKYIFAEVFSIACSMREVATSPPLVRYLIRIGNIIAPNTLFCRRDGIAPLRGCSCAVVRPRRAGFSAVAERNAAGAAVTASVTVRNGAVRQLRSKRYIRQHFYTRGGCGITPSEYHVPQTEPQS